MIFDLQPQYRTDRLEAAVSGEVLILNGEAHDLSAVASSAVINSPWIGGLVQRLSGVLHVPLILPHGATAPPETLFPVPLSVTDGPVPLPPYDTDPSEAAEPEATSDEPV
jgi:hypothetical protein